MEEDPLSPIQHPWYRAVMAPLYLALLLPVVAACIMIPSTDTDSSTYEDLYYSQSFQFSKLVYLYLALTSGFVYVLVVTLRGKRSCSLTSPLAFDFGICLGLGSLLHFLGSNATLLGMSDTSSWTLLLLYNFLVWSFTFWLGVHWTYLDTGELKKLVLSWNYMQHWPTKLWLIFIGGIALCLALTSYQLYLLHTRGLLVYVGLGYSCMMCVLVLVAYCIKDTHEFHLHHYQFFAMLIPITMSQDWVSAACQGFCFGAYCEGLARWGAASLYERKT